MAHPKSIDEIRAELASIILGAVLEEDPMRRKALLTLVDHWSDILRRRRAKASAPVFGPVPQPTHRFKPTAVFG